METTAEFERLLNEHGVTASLTFVVDTVPVVQGKVKLEVRRKDRMNWVATIDERWAQKEPAAAAKWCAENLVHPNANFMARLYLEPGE